MAAIVKDYKTADLSEENRAMLHYAVKLTLNPSDIERRDIDELRARGFSDRAILDICQVVCYFNYVNRLADGLGVELENQRGRRSDNG